MGMYLYLINRMGGLVFKLGGQGQGLVALEKFVKRSFFVRPPVISFIHVQGWVPSFVP